MTIDFIAGFVLVAFGVGIGIVFGRFVFNGGDSSNLKQQLTDLKKEQQDYQSKVNEHFIRTTELIESLNNNYKDIQVHLLQGAEQLVSPDYRLDESGTTDTQPAESKPSLEHPKDWAPKEVDQEGTLSEGYGLKTTDLQQEKP